MNPANPADAREIVTEYALLLEQHTRENAYPVALGALPYSKDTIKSAIRTSVLWMTSNGDLTDEMKTFFELAYVSLADYVDAEVARLMTNYNKAAIRIAGEGRSTKEKTNTSEWETLATSGRLVGEVARSISDDTAALREEFSDFLAAIPDVRRNVGSQR